ncbi:FliM/FliN family flagellar motor switch protein [Prosthecomicrobium sp. N25]|uniref:FliM/FliN family flagellar motor switch protein n=1 Tax=Prosthecomicrobium sp. N25 TaxID=3129254 RepID=UPI0030785A16
MNAPWIAGPGGRLARPEAVWNALVTYARQPLPLAAKGATLTFEPAPRPADDTVALDVAFASGPRLLLVIAAFPFQALFGLDIEADEIAALPAALSGGLQEGILALLAAAAPENALGAPRLLRAGSLAHLARAPDRGPEPREWLSLTVAGLVPAPVRLVAGIDPDRLVALVRDGALAPRQVWPALAATIPVEVFVTLGAMRTTVGELLDLKAGSLVVLAATPPGTARLRVADRTATLAAGANGWTFAAVTDQDRYRPAPGDTAPMTDDPLARPEEGRGLAGLPLVIDFDIGRLTVPLAEVERWTAGTVVPLDLAAPGPGTEVTVRANGQAIATGDLVRIDDRMAVRLTRLMLG